MKSLRTPALSIAFALTLSNQEAILAAPMMSNQSAQSLAELVITMDSTSYGHGDSVKMSVGIKNISGAGIGLSGRPPWVATAITVRDSSGNVVKPNSPPALDESRRSIIIRVAPGETFTLRRNFNDGPEQQFYPLANWGYRDLAPGKYSVSAVESEVLFFPFSEDPSKDLNLSIASPSKSEPASNVAYFTVTS